MAQNEWFNFEGLRPPRVYGLVLAPLSIGHLFLLQEYNSPYRFADGNRRVSQVDLLFAVAFCCRRWSLSRNFPNERLLSWKFRIWGWYAKHMDFQTEHKKFEEYLKSAFADIETYLPKGKSKPVASPIEYRFLARLLSDFNMTYDEAMEFPVWMASRLNLAKSEMSGALEIVDDEARRLFDLAAQN